MPDTLTLFSLAACGHCLELIRRKGIFEKTNCRFAKKSLRNLRVRERETMTQFMQLLSRAFAKIYKCCAGCCQIQKGKKWHKDLKNTKNEMEKKYV